MKLAFVCSGNTCRSPLAWAAWHCLARESEASCCEKLARVEVVSAGLCARQGAPATALARRIGEQWKVDLSAHRARSWNDEAATADWIIAMTREQSAQIRFRLHRRSEREAPLVRVLGSYLPAENWMLGEAIWSAPVAEIEDIFDPYGGSFEAYQECGARILRGVKALQNALCERL